MSSIAVDVRVAETLAFEVPQGADDAAKPQRVLITIDRKSGQMARLLIHIPDHVTLLHRGRRLKNRPAPVDNSEKSGIFPPA